MILGITGKIASGKSEIMKILAKNGFYCIYADAIVYELYKSGGEGYKKIEKIFGKEFVNKNVDRKKLRDLVFNNPEKLEILNKTIHPLVFREINLIIKKNVNKNIAIESIYFDPNFFEKIIDKIVLIDRFQKEIIKILVEKRDFSNILAKKTINYFRMPYKIDFVIKNNKKLSDLKNSMISFLHEI